MCVYMCSPAYHGPNAAGAAAAFFRRSIGLLGELRQFCASNVVVRLLLLPCPQGACAFRHCLPPASPPLFLSLSASSPLSARSPALTFRLACLDRLSFSNSKTHSSCPLLLKVNPPARNLKAASCSHRGALALSPALQIPPPLTHGLCVACETSQSHVSRPRMRGTRS